MATISTPENADPERIVPCRLHVVDENFVPTFGLRVVAGRNLSERSKEQDSVVLNETLAEDLGWTPQYAVGQTLRWNNRKQVTVVPA
jgi:putative ABC transport system permease protein